jgi:A/G-specific adenine glycosylase
VIRLNSHDRLRLLKVRKDILKWFHKNKRELLWRIPKRDPYVVLVSEVMLQQTQVQRVAEYFPKFLDKYPTLESLAMASQSDVIRSWQGLGYNRRALNLHRASQELLKIPFPQTENDLRALPGIGEYTARALMTFAFNKDISVVDVNIARVLSRIVRPMRSLDDTLQFREIHSINEQLLPKGKNPDWTEALMDLGALICKKKPLCSICPLRKDCASSVHLSTMVHGQIQRSEKKYFGYPKRIWRGKILRLITNNEPISYNALIKMLKQDNGSVNINSLVKHILTDLMNEGFIDRINRKYSLR